MLKVAVQMDPVHAVNIETDTTFMLGMEAQNRGHQLWYHGPQNLALENGELFVRAQPLTFRAVKGDHYTLGEPETLKVVDHFDVVLMRQDPPFDMAYVTATYLLEKVHPRVLVVNDPAEVRNAPEKLFVTGFPGLQPPTIISGDPDILADFHRRHGDVVLKPLHGAAGAGVMRLKADDRNLESLVETFAAINRDPLVMQAFLPAVSEGDKRIFLVNGEVVGALNRVPPKDHIRSNLRVGGEARPVELSQRDLEICAVLGPELRRRGLLFVGIDVIGGYLTEINVTSPTGAQQIKRFTGADAAALLWDVIEARRA